MKTDVYDLVIYGLIAIFGRENVVLCMFMAFSLRNRVHFYIVVNIVLLW